MARRWLLVSCALLAVVTGGRRAAAASDDATPPLQATPVADAMHRKAKVSVGFHYSSGDYGASSSTEIFYVPLLLRAEISRWTLQMTIPYIRVDGPAGIVNGPAGPIETSGKGEGLGDVFFRAAFLLPTYSWPSWVPFVELGGLVKFPTASRGDGLGTGEFDFGVDCDLTWSLGRMTPFARVEYRFLGDPPDIDLNDVFGTSVGAQFRIIDSVHAGALVDYRQPSSAATDEQLEIIPFASWAFVPSWLLESYVAAGLSEGSPDVAVGVQLAYTW